MTDEQAFLAAIATARPGDDLPRLAFADWLEEQAGVVPRGKLRKRCPNGTRFASGHLMSDDGLRCLACGQGQVSNGFAERAELERLRVEIDRRRRDPERPVDDGKTFFGMYLLGWLQGRHIDTYVLNRVLYDRPCDCELCLVKQAKEILVKLGAIEGAGARRDG